MTSLRRVAGSETGETCDRWQSSDPNQFGRDNHAATRVRFDLIEQFDSDYDEVDRDQLAGPQTRLSISSDFSKYLI